LDRTDLETFTVKTVRQLVVFLNLINTFHINKLLILPIQYIYVADALIFLVTALPAFFLPTAQGITPQSIEEELHRPRE